MASVDTLREDSLDRRTSWFTESKAFSRSKQTDFTTYVQVRFNALQIIASGCFGRMVSSTICCMELPWMRWSVRWSATRLSATFHTTGGMLIGGSFPTSVGSPDGKTGPTAADIQASGENLYLMDRWTRCTMGSTREYLCLFGNTVSRPNTHFVLELLKKLIIQSTAGILNIIIIYGIENCGLGWKSLSQFPDGVNNSTKTVKGGGYEMGVLN